MARTEAGHSPVEALHDEVYGHLQGMDEFIAQRCVTQAPVRPEDKDGRFWLRNTRMGMGQTFQSLRLAPGSPHPRIFAGNPTTVAYECVEYGAADEIAWSLSKRSQYPGDLVDEAAENVARALAMELENTLALLLFTAGNWAAGATEPCTTLDNNEDGNASGVQFGAANATEIKDLLICKKLARNNCNGVDPNAMIIGYEAFHALQTAVDFRSFLSADSDRTALGEEATIAALSRALGIPAENIFVGKARQETANPGQTSSTSDVWADNVLLYHLDSRITTMSGGAGLRGTTAAIAWEQLDGGVSGIYAEQDEDRELRTDIVRGRFSFDSVLLNNSWGFLLTDCVAPLVP